MGLRPGLGPEAVRLGCVTPGKACGLSGLHFLLCEFTAWESAAIPRGEGHAQGFPAQLSYPSGGPWGQGGEFRPLL